MADLASWSALMAPGDEPDSVVDLLTTGRPGWFADALCREHAELSWFPGPGESSAPALAVCRRCLVRDQCRDYAVADPGLQGVWGATSVRERGRLRRRARSRPSAA